MEESSDILQARQKIRSRIFLWPSQVEATPESLRESSLTWLTVHVPLSQIKVLESRRNAESSRISRMSRVEMRSQVEFRTHESRRNG